MSDSGLTDTRESLEKRIDEMATGERRSYEEMTQEPISAYRLVDELSRMTEQRDHPGTSLAGETDATREINAGDDENEDGEEIDASIDRFSALEAAFAALDADAVERSAFKQVRETVDTLDTELGEIQTQCDRLQAQLDALPEEPAPKEGVLEVVRQVSTVTESITERHEDLRDRVETDFANLQTILEYLFETSERLTGEIEPTVQTNHRQLQQFRAERDRLTELKGAAIRQGVETAACESCENTVDCALLERPYCPYCNATFSALERQSGRFFGSAILATTDAPLLEESDHREKGHSVNTQQDNRRDR